MNHAFIASGGDDNICVKCKFTYAAHTDQAECDCCPNKGPVEIRYGNMLMCAECWDKEQKLSAESMKPENQQKRIDEMNARMKQTRETDASIQVRTDIFNAETTSIVDLKKLIDDNPAIVNKPYALAEELMNRLQQYRKSAFELQEQLVVNNSNQRAIQQYMNDLANKLRAEEREKLKIADINYKPGIVKPVKPKSITTTGTKPPKVDKKLRAKYALELGVSEFTLQQMVVISGGDLEKAVAKLKASIAAAKAQ